jgi:hypothetical protein
VKPSRQYQPGDQVYLDASKIKTTHASKKLDTKFHRPFKVISVVGKAAYKLELPPGWGIHDVFHESKLKPVTTWYGLLHYANLIRRTGPYLFSLSTYLI